MSVSEVVLAGVERLVAGTEKDVDE